MDTTEVAKRIGTTARVLRAFLRSNHSTFVAVGSGARYTFTEKEIPTIHRRFAEWQKDGKPRPQGTPPKPVTPRTRQTPLSPHDTEVWAEEGHVVIEDIRDPRVRARVLRDAKAAEDRLMAQLIASGLHVYQGFSHRLKGK